MLMYLKLQNQEQGQKEASVVVKAGEEYQHILKMQLNY